MKKFLLLLTINILHLNVAGILKTAKIRTSQRYHQFPFSLRLIYVAVGTPPVRISLLPSFQFDELIFLDINCGISLTNCATYCHNDDAWMKMYCNPLCRPITPQMREGLCVTGTKIKVYNGSKSTTSKRTGNDWVRTPRGVHALFGYEWSDALFVAGNGLGKRMERLLDFGKATFVSAMRFDMRILEALATWIQPPGILGLAPGDKSPFMQIIKQENKHPIVTFANHKINRFQRTSKTERLVTVGAADKANCAPYMWIKSASEQSWVIEADSIDFMGYKITEKTLIILSFGIDFTILPSDLGIQLTAANIIYHYPLSTYRPCPDKTVPDIRIQAGTQQLIMSKTSTVKDYRGDECTLYIRTNTTSPYSVSGVWLLGDNILEEFCVALDYSNLMIGFGKRRYRAEYHRWDE